MTISVIIPALDEAESLPGTLRALADAGTLLEVIVVDGGSQDATADIARASGARLLSNPRPQRAAQMNLGAAEAHGDALLFLHADTRLAPRALEAVAAALASPGTVGGAFLRFFESPSRLLRWTCRLGAWRARRLGWYFGDQGIFVRRDVFRELGGYRDCDVFEDLEFSRRLKRAGRVVLIELAAKSSARRFATQGVLWRTLADVWLTCLYLAGANPQRLALWARRPHAIEAGGRRG